jgi:hypothetical protein
MTIPQITFFDAITCEVITRDMNASEVAQREADKLEADQKAEALAKDRADKAATRAAVLTRLGLSSDELLALLS